MISFGGSVALIGRMHNNMVEQEKRSREMIAEKGLPYHNLLAEHWLLSMLLAALTGIIIKAGIF